MMVRLGNWLFHYRNFLFPLFYIALFIPSPPFLSKGIIPEVTGLILIFTGIFIRCITIGLVYIIRGGKNREIFAEDLVTGGIYSVCRNPMYLGNIILLMGFGLFANSMLFLLIFFPLFVLFYVAIIRAEEAFLTNKFGEKFITYKNNVNALIPDPGKLGGAFKGQRFKWKKVLSKEHNSLYVYLSGILLLLLYKSEIELNVFIISILTLSILYGAVKWMKVKKLLVE